MEMDIILRGLSELEAAGITRTRKEMKWYFTLFSLVFFLYLHTSTIQLMIEEMRQEEKMRNSGRMRERNGRAFEALSVV